MANDMLHRQYMLHRQAGLHPCTVHARLAQYMPRKDASAPHPPQALAPPSVAGPQRSHPVPWAAPRPVALWDPAATAAAPCCHAGSWPGCRARHGTQHSMTGVVRQPAQPSVVDHSTLQHTTETRINNTRHIQRMLLCSKGEEDCTSNVCDHT